MQSKPQRALTICAGCGRQAIRERDARANPIERHVWKLRLVRGLFERGFNAKDVPELFRTIHWLKELPPPLEYTFWRQVENVQKERTMPYITGYERAGHGIGLRKGIKALLRVRFGDEGLKLMPEINEIYDDEQLDKVLTALETVASPDELRRLWTPGGV